MNLSVSSHMKSSVVLIIAPKIYNDKTEVIAIFNPSQVLSSASLAE